MMRHASAQITDGDLAVALGLVWGHVHTGQFEKADRLVRGCLEVWPDCRQLRVMAAFAAIEGGWQAEEDIVALARSTDCGAVASVMLRRLSASANFPEVLPKSSREA